MRLLSGKICLITGGGGSLGIAVAKLFLSQGAKLALVDLDERQLRDVVEQNFEDNTGEILLIGADVSDEEDTKRYVAQTVGHFGRIDVLFSNAGNSGVVAPIEEFPTDVFDQTYRVHVRGAFLAAKYAVPYIGPGGSIIITSSVAALRGDPGVHAYIPAKHAQTGLMKCLAAELAPRDIRVNSINPGPIDNEFQKRIEEGLGSTLGIDGTEFFNAMIPMGRHGTPAEIAKSVLFLASDQSSFTTGTILRADGGMGG